MKFIESIRIGILSQSINDVYVPIQKKVMPIIIHLNNFLTKKKKILKKKKRQCICFLNF